MWEYPTEQGHHDLYMDIGEPIKFRVSGEVFEESSPVGPQASDSNKSSAAQSSTTNCSDTKTPYKIIVHFLKQY